MRGADISQNALFVTVTVEDFVPLDHPLRALRDLINEALKDLDGLFGSIYADAGRESIPRSAWSAPCCCRSCTRSAANAS